MIWYCDSSALVKRYVREVGSIWFRQQLSRHQLISSTICIAEVPSALSRQHRDGILSRFEFQRGRIAFNRHIEARTYTLIGAPMELIKQAARLIYRAPLSALDAIHLATAVHYQKTLRQQSRFYFVTADDQLERAAIAEGLQTENPNAHA